LPEKPSAEADGAFTFTSPETSWETESRSHPAKIAENWAFRCVGAEDAVGDQPGEQFAGAALLKATDAARLAPRELAALEHLLQDVQSFGFDSRR
jgi:hypothetical protein